MGARTVAGSKWDHAVPNFTLETNGVQEFKLKGATGWAGCDGGFKQ